MNMGGQLAYNMTNQPSKVSYMWGWSLNWSFILIYFPRICGLLFEGSEATYLVNR